MKAETPVRYKPPLEKAQQRAIIHLLRIANFRVRSTSQGRPSHVALGLPDLLAHHLTLPIFLWFEVKRPKATAAFRPYDPTTWEPEPLRPEQEVFRQDCERAGIRYYWGTLRDAEDALIDCGIATRSPAGVFALDWTRTALPNTLTKKA